MSDFGLDQHVAYVERWKRAGKPTQILTTPCCTKALEVPAPSSVQSKQWDSLMTCPHCGEMFMKIVTSAKAEGRSINWDAVAS